MHQNVAYVIRLKFVLRFRFSRNTYRLDDRLRTFFRYEPFSVRKILRLRRPVYGNIGPDNYGNIQSRTLPTIRHVIRVQFRPRKTRRRHRLGFRTVGKLGAALGTADLAFGILVYDVQKELAVIANLPVRTSTFSGHRLRVNGEYTGNFTPRQTALDDGLTARAADFRRIAISFEMRFYRHFAFTPFVFCCLIILCAANPIYDFPERKIPASFSAFCRKRKKHAKSPSENPTDLNRYLFRNHFSLADKF